MHFSFHQKRKHDKEIILMNLNGNDILKMWERIFLLEMNFSWKHIKINKILFFLARKLSKCHNGAANNFLCGKFSSSISNSKLPSFEETFLHKAIKMPKMGEKILNKILWKHFYYVMKSLLSSLTKNKFIFFVKLVFTAMGCVKTLN